MGGVGYSEDIAYSTESSGGELTMQLKRRESATKGKKYRESAV